MMLLAMLATLATAACGPDEPDRAPTGLLDRLSPMGSPAATLVDLVRLRKELGLPADHGRATGDRTPAQLRFDSILSMAYPVWATAFQSPARDAIDIGRVTTVANNGRGRQGVTVLATGQKLGDITAALRQGGYTEDGGVWRAPAGNRATEAAAIAGGDGFLVTGADAVAVRLAAEGKGTGIRGRVRDLIAELDAPAAAAAEFSEGCIDAAAVADDVAGQKGRLKLVVPGASADRMKTGRTQQFTVEEPKLDGDTVTVTLTHERAETTPLQFVGGESSFSELYDC